MFIPYGRQNIDSTDLAAVLEALQGDLITTGDKVAEFEEALKNTVQAPCVVVNSGTSALHAAYFAAGLERGDEILTPPNTFVATQAAAIHLGLKVRFVDIDLESGLISHKDLEKKVSKKTKAIVVVDYAGQPVDVPAIREIVGNRNISIIEDASHSLGSTFEGRPVGSIADITTFSFYPTKNITTGEGGAVASLDPDIVKKARLFSRQGLVRDASDFILESDGPWHQEVQFFGHNYRLTDFQCALGISQLRRLEVFKNARREIFLKYKDFFQGIDDVQTLKVDKRSDCVWHLFPVRIPKNRRREVFESLRAWGIGVQVNYVPAYKHPAFKARKNFATKFPNSEEFYASEISLPIFVGLTLEEIETVCNKFLDAIHEPSSV